MPNNELDLTDAEEAAMLGIGGDIPISKKQWVIAVDSRKDVAIRINELLQDSFIDEVLHNTIVENESHIVVIAAVRLKSGRIEVYVVTTQEGIFWSGPAEGEGTFYPLSRK